MDNFTINQAIRQSADHFINECDHAYRVQVFAAAEAIAACMERSPIILLSGPSGSSKTTTAENLAGFLCNFGIRCHMISLDNYYRDRAAGDYPRDENGNIDLESPYGLDIDLLNEHIEALGRGEELRIPHFDFTAQARDPARTRTLRLGAHEAVLFEGINALNPMFTQPHPDATRVYVAPTTPITCKGKVLFDCEKIRLLRRTIRDNNFRGQTPIGTLSMWESVRRGERLFIAPYADTAHIHIDTTLGYEIPVLGYLSKPMLETLPQDVPQRQLVDEILQALPAIAPIGADLVPETSLLRREFLKL